MIGLLGAMDEEVVRLREAMEAPERVALGGREYFRGRLFGRDCVLTSSRMGKVAAASTATTLLQRFGAGLVVFTGVAGGAAPEARAGDVVIADELVQHDMDARPIFPRRFEIPLLGIVRFPARADLRAKALRAAEEFLAEDLEREVRPATLRRLGVVRPKALHGLVASGDRFVADPEVLAGIARDLPDLLCVEMEGAAVAQVCHEHGVPWVVARFLSDRADRSAAEDFLKFLPELAGGYARGFVRRLFPLL
jgi:adenosylhomocysteine nucleosidase